MSGFETLFPVSTDAGEAKGRAIAEVGQTTEDSQRTKFNGYPHRARFQPGGTFLVGTSQFTPIYDDAIRVDVPIHGWIALFASVTFTYNDSGEGELWLRSTGMPDSKIWDATSASVGSSKSGRTIAGMAGFSFLVDPDAPGSPWVFHIGAGLKDFQLGYAHPESFPGSNTAPLTVSNRYMRIWALDDGPTPTTGGSVETD